MSRLFLTELEQVDYLIGTVYVNPNYDDNVTAELNYNKIILSPPEINVMTSNKTYPSVVVESGKRNIYDTNIPDNLESKSNRDDNMTQIDVKQSLLNIVNSDQHIKETFANKYTNTKINYNNIRQYFIK